MMDSLTPTPVSRWLRNWAWLTVCAAVPLALLGAETTTRGVGMVDSTSVREPWYFFTLDLRNTPLGLLIEHGHRLFGWTVGMCSIVLAVWLTFAVSDWRRWLGWLALVMVSMQGIFGILRVRYNAWSGPELAALHGCFAQLAFGTLVLVAVLCSNTWSLPAESRSGQIGGLALCVVIYVQIVFGALTRHLADPLAQRLHILLAFAVMGVLFWLHGRLQREGKNLAARNTAMLLAVFVLIQPILGVEAWMRRFAGNPLPDLVPSDPVLSHIRSAHQILGTLIFTTSVALAALLYRPVKPAAEQMKPALHHVTGTPMLERSA